MKFDITPGPVGLVSAENEDIALVGGMRSGSSSSDTTRRKYNIYDIKKWQEMLDRGLAEHDIEPKCKVGFVELFVKDGQSNDLAAKGLVNIRIEPAFRKQGFARKVIDGIQATTQESLKIHDIKKSAEKVWKKLGIENIHNGDGVIPSPTPNLDKERQVALSFAKKLANYGFLMKEHVRVAIECSKESEGNFSLASYNAGSKSLCAMKSEISELMNMQDKIIGALPDRSNTIEVELLHNAVRHQISQYRGFIKAVTLQPYINENVVMNASKDVSELSELTNQGLKEIFKAPTQIENNQEEMSL